MDDSLLREFELKANTVIISGVMIWGIDGTTEQWTDPFHFELDNIVKMIICLKMKINSKVKDSTKTMIIFFKVY